MVTQESMLKIHLLMCVLCASCLVTKLTTRTSRIKRLIVYHHRPYMINNIDKQQTPASGDARPKLRFDKNSDVGVDVAFSNRAVVVYLYW